MAVRLAERGAAEDVLAGDATTPLSLYKGHVGLALLAAELDEPAARRDAAVRVRAGAANIGRVGRKVGVAAPGAPATATPYGLRCIRGAARRAG